MTLPNYNDSLCPVCGYKIGEHTDSPFGHNPKMNVSTGEIAPECPRIHSRLVIAILRNWWEDALGERDAYMKSYKEVCDERDILQKKFDYITKTLNSWDTNNYYIYSDMITDLLKYVKEIK